MGTGPALARPRLGTGFQLGPDVLAGRLLVLSASGAALDLVGTGLGGDRTWQLFPFYGHRDHFPNKNWGHVGWTGFFSYLLNYFCGKSDKGIKIRSLLTEAFSKSPDQTKKNRPEVQRAEEIQKV